VPRRLIRMTGILIVIVVGLSFVGCVSFKANHINVSDLGSVDMTQDFVTGKACSTSILGLFPMGNSSIAEAARNGGVQYIDYVETDVGFFLLVIETCTTVYGHNSP
jgi:hypothetical protein